MIHFEHLTYTYPGAIEPALRDVSLQLPEGELILVIGPSGSGKSTLLRCINGLVPHFSGGALAGNVRVQGLDPVEATPKVLSRHVGFVFQDPEAQFVMDRVEDEIAFALENAAMSPQEMRVRVEETLDLLDLEPLRDRPLKTLSGGERQRVAIGAALALRPHILVLDEPTSQLDPKSAEDVLNALVRLNTDLGLTILLAEHRLERVLPYVDRIVYLPDDGSPILIDEPRAVLSQIELGPPLVRLGKALAWEPLPLTIKEGLRFSRAHLAGQKPAPGTAPLRPLPGGPVSGRPAPRPRTPFIEATNVSVQYGNRLVVRGVNFAARPGEIVALMGRNGAGKTSLVKALVGLVSPQSGEVRIEGVSNARRSVAEICRQVGYLPQDPNTLLFAETVHDEMMVTLRNHGLAQNIEGQWRVLPGARAADPTELLRRLRLGGKAGAYPRDLSVGERQRVALAAITVTLPGALLLDEPTRGLDYLAKQELVVLLKQWRADGMAIVLVTHDVELAAALADRVVLMSQGEVIADGPTAEVLGSSPLFAPQVARLFPNMGWLTTEDVLAAGVA
jgi:energy-coupling factor transport system ATP-binding protein